MIDLQICEHCQTVLYPKRDVCPECLSDNISPFLQKAVGHLISVTTLYVSAKPEWQAKLPLRIGLIKLDVGPKVLAFLQANERTGQRLYLTQIDGIFTARSEDI